MWHDIAFAIDTPSKTVSAWQAGAGGEGPWEEGKWQRNLFLVKCDADPYYTRTLGRLFDRTMGGHAVVGWGERGGEDKDFARLAAMAWQIGYASVHRRATNRLMLDRFWRINRELTHFAKITTYTVNSKKRVTRLPFSYL